MNQSDLYARLRETVLAALAQVVPDLPAEVAARVEVSSAKDPAHGDMATNAAMVSAKAARQPPAKLAAALVQHLNAAPEIASAEAAGPGFVNLRLRPETFRALFGGELRVLDSTEPVTVKAALDAGEPKGIALIASKSGGTVEPNSMLG